MSLSKTYNIDCLEAMKRMDENQFDLAIVDPPYGIGDTWSKSRKDRFYKKGALHSYQNDSIPQADYWNQLFRVSKNQIVFGGNYFSDFLKPTNAWIVWDKVRDADKTFMSEAELAWTSFKKTMRIIQLQWDGAKKCEKITKWHPHQKPIKLYETIIEKYAEPGYSILDTHIGSGSSRIACYNKGFDFTGYEIDPHYFNIQNKKFKEFTAQQVLFKTN